MTNHSKTPAQFVVCKRFTLQKSGYRVWMKRLLFFNANDNTFLTISFGPTDNEDFRPISSIMVASIQLVSEAE